MANSLQWLYYSSGVRTPSWTWILSEQDLLGKGERGREGFSGRCHVVLSVVNIGVTGGGCSVLPGETEIGCSVLIEEDLPI